MIQALETLKLWELQQDDGNIANLRLYDSIGKPHYSIIPIVLSLIT